MDLTDEGLYFNIFLILIKLISEDFFSLDLYFLINDFDFELTFKKFIIFPN